MLRMTFLLLTSCLLVVTGCKDSLPTLTGFDKTAWVNDKYGCNGDRQNQLDVVTQQQDKLLTLNQNQIKQLLGNPDEHELYERTRKFFHYYIDPANKCDSTSNNPAPKILQIRFNALGLCNEVFVKNGE